MPGSFVVTDWHPEPWGVNLGRAVGDSPSVAILAQVNIRTTFDRVSLRTAFDHTQRLTLCRRAVRITGRCGAAQEEVQAKCRRRR